MYHSFIDATGRQWFYNDQEVWVHNPKDETGLSGDTKTFPLVGGEASITVKGPWCSNLLSLICLDSAWTIDLSYQP